MDTTDVPTLTGLVVFEHPDSSTPAAEYAAVEASNESCDYYSVNPPNKVKNGMILKQSAGNDVLDYATFYGSFDEWVAENANPPWCEVAKELKEKRPKELLRRVLRAIIKAVGALHKSGRAHGGLRHKGNYYIRVRGDGAWGEGVDVELLHVEGEVVVGTDLLEMMKKDMEDLREMIFEDVLKIEIVVGEVEEWEKRIADDLLHLEGIMRASAVRGGDEKQFDLCWNLMLDHTGLWHSWSRLQLYENAWIAYKEASPVVRHRIKGTMARRWDASKKWKKKIQKNAFLNRMEKKPYNRPAVGMQKSSYNQTGVGMGSSYNKAAVGLLRYLRDVGLHAKKDKNDREKAYFDKQANPEYMKEEYLEKLLRDTFPRSTIALQAVMFEAEIYLDDFAS